MEKYYEIELFYSLNYLEELPIVHDKNYLVIINEETKKESKKESEDIDEEDNKIIEPNIIIYRFEKDNKTSLFAALYESDLDCNPHNDEKEEYFEIVDSALSTEADSETYLYIIMLAKSGKGDYSRKDKLIMKKFHLGEFVLEYDLKSYRFRDSLDFVALDFFQNRVGFKMEAVLVSNHTLYVFLFISSACLIIVVVLSLIVGYKLWEYKKLKRTVDGRVQEDRQRQGEDSSNDLMSGIESHFQDQNKPEDN